MVMNVGQTDNQAVDVLTAALSVDVAEWPNVSEHVQLAQSAVLLRVASNGQLTEACRFTQVSFAAVNQWRDRDVGGFRDRLALARQVFADSLEVLAFDRVRLQTPGANPMLLIRLLEAHLPDRYKLASDTDINPALEFLAKVKMVANTQQAALSLPQAADEGMLGDKLGPIFKQ